jgi:TRAP-type C4-dicarboxylate transport system permease small subunit
VSISCDLHTHSNKEAVSQSIIMKIDDHIYRSEVYIVTLALVCMSITVGLDIFYRMLTQVMTYPWVYLMNGFGFCQKFTPKHIVWDLTPIIILMILAALITYLRRSHSSEESSNKDNTDNERSNITHRTHSNHQIWIKEFILILVSFYLVSFALYQFSSYIICILLIITLAIIIYRKQNKPALSKVVTQIVISLVLCLIAYHTPQDYIWSQEFSLIMMAWLSFVGASMACYHHKHIQMNGLSICFPKRWHIYIRSISFLLTAGFTAYLSYLFIEDIWGARGTFYSQARRPSTGIPEWLIVCSGVWCFVIMTIRCLVYAWQNLRSPYSHDQHIRLISEEHT